MDIVNELVEKFEELKSQNSENISSLIETLKISAKDEDSLRWDVLRAVVCADFNYLHIVTVAELEHSYSRMKESIVDCPKLLDIIVMNLHADYLNNKSILNSIDIQKRIFGEELFSEIEIKTHKFLSSHCHRMLTENIPASMTQKDFASMMSNVYESDYRNYHYWPTIKSVIDNVITTE